MQSHRVLVTGGAGFIGSFIVDHFVQQGSEVVIYDSLDPQVHGDKLPAYLNPAAELIKADVRDREALSRAVEGCDVIVHCAAAVGVAQSLYEVERYVDVNVRGTATLLDILVEKKPQLRKLIVLTSMTQYGEGMYRAPSSGKLVRPIIRSTGDIEAHGWEPVDPGTGEALEPVPILEDAELQAQNIYALTKKYQEELTLSTSRLYGFPAVCFRMFNVYGPRQSLNNPYTGVLAIFLNRFLQGQAPTIYEDGLQSRDFISVHDIVHAVSLAVERPHVENAIMNLGSGTPRRIIDCANELARQTGSELRVEADGRFRAGDVRHCIADISRARDTLGFAPRVSWEDGLAELIAWSKQAELGATDFSKAERELRAHGLVK